MADKIEELIKIVYRDWKKNHPKPEEPHIDEESLACFLEGRLPAEEAEQVKTHLLSCDSCSEGLALALEAEAGGIKEVPEELLLRLKEILGSKIKSALEIFLRLKDGIFEIINVSGDILVGQELVPAPVLRSRNIKSFKGEINVLKDFKDARLEIKVENKDAKFFDLTVQARKKHGPGLLKDLRVTLIKDNIELESYLSDAGSVNFEHILPGEYTLAIFSLTGKLATVVLNVKA